MAGLTDDMVRELSPPLLRFAACLTPTDAEDLVQDAFLGVLRRPILPENLRGFLMTSIRNAAFSRYRHERRRRVESLDAPVRFYDEDAEHEGEMAPRHARLADPTDVADEATTRVLLGGALARLAPDRYATPLVAYGLGWHYNEIAAASGVSLPAVKAGINRARARLR